MDYNLAQQNNRERLAGLLLIAAAAAALIASNSPFAPLYEDLLHLKLGVDLAAHRTLDVHTLGGRRVDGDLLPARRAGGEARMVRGPPGDARGAAAAGARRHRGDGGPRVDLHRRRRRNPALGHGWAIPAATDIAFALAVLAILGRHVPPSIKVLLVTVAIIDDVGAVAIIALFYTHSLDTDALALAFGVMVALAHREHARRAAASLPHRLCRSVVPGPQERRSRDHRGVLAAATVPLGKGEANRRSRRSSTISIRGSCSASCRYSASSAPGWRLAAELAPCLRRSRCHRARPVRRQAGWGVRRHPPGGCGGICCKPEGTSWRQIYGAALFAASASP